MAKVQFGNLASDVRNKIGGTVFSKGRFGAYVRRKVSPVQPRSLAQTSVRSILAGLASAWGSDLIATQRAAWIAFAQNHPVTDQFSQSHVLTGMQMYVRANRVILGAGGARIDDPPATFSVPGISALTFAATVSGLVVSVTALDPLPTGDQMVQFYATRPLNPGRSFINNLLRLIDVKDNTIALPYALTTKYAAKFSPFLADQVIGLGAVLIDSVTGAQSPMATTTDIAA